MAEVLALIPARSGSKGVVHKNIQKVAGKPLMAYSIEHALAAKLVDRTVVSTDSREYAEIARQFGAEVPFLRPPEISGDHSTDLEAFTHALRWFEKNENYKPEILLHLRPTFPVRDVADVEACIRILIENPDVDSVRSVVPAAQTPYKMWSKAEGNMLSPVIESNLPEPWNMPRQKLPRVYEQNACIDALRADVILKKKSMTGDRIYGYEMERNFDVDTLEELKKAEKELLYRSALEGGEKTFCFDVDGVIAAIHPENKYDETGPIPENIVKINRLFDAGHKIVLFTARGSLTGIDWREVTKKQMKEWGVRHHELRFGKPAADFYVDDKMLSMKSVF